MKVETLRAKGLRFEPDLVILNVAGNNLDLPSYVRLPRDPLAADRSFVLDFLRGLHRRKAETRERDAALAHVDKRKLPGGHSSRAIPMRSPQPTATSWAGRPSTRRWTSSPGSAGPTVSR